ncbi:MAG: phosphodiester glycosidase family protein [Actinomycetota bacterium]|nr:phosphodiester glycosidase family protein [Actinomycetota bacterium]
MRRTSLKPWFVPATGSVVVSVVALACLTAPASAATPTRDLARAVEPLPGDEVIVTARDRVRVAPGLVHSSFESLDERGWIRADILTADLARDGLAATYLGAPAVSSPGPLSGAVERAGAVAGVNADFFDINDTGAPLGVGIDDGDLVHAPSSGHNLTVALDEADTAWIGQTFLDATVTMPGGDGEPVEVEVTNLNSPSVAVGGIAVFTPLWGSVARGRTLDGATDVHEVSVTDGIVTASDATTGEGPIEAGTTVLVGREAGADLLRGLDVGDTVQVDFGVRTDPAGRDPAVAVSGNIVLLEDGVVATTDDTSLAPRTAVGIDDDTDEMILVAIDGRQAASRGLSLLETAELLRDLGAEEALNLDGGGSSTMLARRPGGQPRVVNAPSDGAERNVPNGLGFTVAAGSGTLTGVTLATRYADDGAAEPDAGRGPIELLSGLSRAVVASGHDEMLSPVSIRPSWHSTRPGRVAVQPSGRSAVVVGVEPGRAQVRVTDRGRRSARTVIVHGRPVRVFTDVGQVALTDAGSSARFSVDAADADGFRTDVEPRDVTLDYDRDVVSITRSGGGFDVTPEAGTGATVITVEAGGRTTYLGVTVGLTPTDVADLESTEGWTATRAPASTGAQISSAPGHVGQGIALDYALTGSTATRAAYLAKVGGLELPGNPLQLGMWVQGDGQGGWLRANVIDAAGVRATLDLARTVDFSDWRFLQADIPAGLPRPIRFERVYVVETAPARQYEGRLVFDELSVASAPAIQVPDPPLWRDPVVAGGDRVDAGRWHVAVMSDAQFVGTAPDSDIVAQARRTMREMVATDPDFVVILGDLVDTAFQGDLDLAERIIDEELDGRVPWYYVPGNHETYGVGDLSAWRERFGDPVRTFDRRGTRFVLLDSSMGSLRTSSFEQLLVLRRALEEAADDPAVRSVVVMAHHPTKDPAVVGNSELSDPLEVRLVQEWLAGFSDDTDKPAAYVAAHAGAFHADRLDGVSYLVNGNSGKSPAAAPDDGGFTGWTTLGLATGPTLRRAGPWLLAEMRAHVDRLEVSGPGRLAVSRRARVTATVTQAGREVPVAYPVSASWSVSDDAVLAGSPCPADCVAVFDPRTGRLRAFRPGVVTVTVEVNDTAADTVVRIRR